MTSKKQSNTGHRGWLVTSQDGAWVARVKRPGVRGKYHSKSFPTKSAAESWARAGAAAVLLRQDASNPTALPIKPTDTLMHAYLGRLSNLGRAPGHVVEVHRVLRMVAAAVPVLTDPGAPGALANWLDEVSRTIEPATRNRYRATVRAFCRWCVAQNLIPGDPSTRLERATVPKRLKPQFTLEELRALLSAVDDPYWLYFTVLMYTGMRVGEAAGLHWSDVDWSGGMVWVKLRAGTRVKRQKERMMPLQDELRARLYPLRPALDGPVCWRGAWNGVRDFRRFLERHGVAVAGRSPHSTRHTYAGLMTATGCPSHLLALYMGHDAAATSMEYSKMALHYAQVVSHWPRGTLRLCPVAISSAEEELAINPT